MASEQRWEKVEDSGGFRPFGLGRFFNLAFFLSLQDQNKQNTEGRRSQRIQTSNIKGIWDEAE